MIDDDELQVRTRLIVINDDWARDEEELTKGNRRKFVAVPKSDGAIPVSGVPKVIVHPDASPLPGPWFWKASLDRYPLEFWSEVFAYQFGEIVGVEVPPCLPSIYKEQYGSLSLFFVNRFTGEFLVHGGDMFVLFHPEYDRKRGEEHSFQLIEKALGLDDLQQHVSKVFEQLVFDGIIGNGDRHQDNWGIVVHPNHTPPREWPHRVAPTFDNGTSLGRELSEQTVEAMLKDGSRFEAYINRGKAHAKWESNRLLISLMHEDLVAHILHEFPDMKPVAERILNFDLRRIETAVSRISALSQGCGGVEISSPTGVHRPYGFPA